MSENIVRDLRFLNQNERQVFHLFMLGKRTREISVSLHVSAKTIYNHCASINTKLAGTGCHLDPDEKGFRRLIHRMIAHIIWTVAFERRDNVVLPPGLRLWRLAEFFSTKKTYDSIFFPLLADFHHEYFEALRDGREWKARWLRVLYCGAFFKSAGLNVAMRFLREAWARFKRA